MGYSIYRLIIYMTKVTIEKVERNIVSRCITKLVPPITSLVQEVGAKRRAKRRSLLRSLHP